MLKTSEKSIEYYLNKGILNAGDDTAAFIIQRADELKENGIDVIRMDMGTPDVDAPVAAKKAALEAMESGKSRYTDLRGVACLREAIARKEKRDNSTTWDPDNEIIVTVGASEALLTVFCTFLKAGDEIIIPTPSYCAYFYILTTLGIKVKEVPIVQDSKVIVNVKEFEQNITDKTRMILINSPHNPTGLVYTHEEIREFAKIAQKHNLIIVSDECYDKYSFVGERYGIINEPGMKERTITVNSVSKSYGMTGWRVGYIAAKKEFCEYMQMFHGNLILCAPSFAQYGAAAAFDGETKEQMDSLRKTYKERRDCIIETLEEIEKLQYVHPNGAFYVFVNVEKTGLSGYDFASKFLEEYQVSCCPGEVYGQGYDNYIRLSYTSSLDNIKDAMQRLKIFVQSL